MNDTKEREVPAASEDTNLPQPETPDPATKALSTILRIQRLKASEEKKDELLMLMIKKHKKTAS